MKILSATDYSYRKVIRVVEDDTIPEWVHQDSAGNWTVPHTPGLAVNAAGALERGLAAGTGCHACRYNWKVTEHVVTDAKLEVGLNKWGNPAHDGQDVLTTRSRTWDELYAEVDQQLGRHADFGAAPRQASPPAVAEFEPEFELVAAGDPGLADDGRAHQRYKVLRYGEAKMVMTAFGKTREAFLADRDTKYAMAKEQILEAETSRAAAAAIVAGP